MSTFWMHGLPGEHPEEHARFLADQGVRYVVTGADPAAIHAARSAGLKVYLCSGAFGKGNRPDDLLSVDVNGDRQIWFGSTCPNRPEVREANLRSIAEMAAIEGIEGIFIDGCRFASPASGLEPFFTCFCPVCEEKATRLGFDFPRMKADVTVLYRMIVTGEAAAPWAQAARSPSSLLPFLVNHPGVNDWLRFREVCTTEHLINMKNTIKRTNPALRFAIYIFTPALSALVGQNYAVLRDHLDLFAPMIYRNFPPPDGPACLNRELFDIAGWFEGSDEALVMSALSRFFGLPLTTRAEVGRGLPPESVGTEVARARTLLGPDKDLVPILYLDDDRIEASMRTALENGADGLSFFVYNPELQEKIRRAGAFMRANG